MRQRVLIHVDSLRRDGAACITLAHILRERKLNVTVSGQETTAHYIKYWRPHLLLHTAASKIAAYHKLGIISLKNRPLIHYLPQEGRPTKPESIHLCYQPLTTTNFALVDHVYVWNKVHYDWLQSHSPLPENRVQIVGGYRLDMAKYGSSPNLKERPSVVGFIGRFTALSPHDGDYGLHLTAKTAPALRHKLPKITAQVRACMIYSYLINTLMEKTDFVVSLRPHHNEYPHSHFYSWAKERFGKRVQIDTHLSFYEWASNKLALISTASSTFAEVTLAQTPLICIDQILDHEISWSHDAGSKQVMDSFQDQRLPSSFDEILEFLDKTSRNFVPSEIEPSIGSLLQEQYMWPYEGSSLLAIADNICRSLAHSYPQQPLLPKVSGDLAYLFGVLQAYRSGTFRQRLNYVYNDRVHGRSPFFKNLATRISREKPYQHQKTFTQEHNQLASNQLSGGR